MTLRPLLPAGWPIPRGFAHGMEGRGRLVVIGGQVGSDAEGHFAPGFVAQARQALANVVAVVREAGGEPQDVARLTWYITDLDDYRSGLAALGTVYRAVMGRHFPAMTLVQVAGLVEPEALIEIEALAVLPEA